jgi:uncharacterized protein (TIGR02453 family)
MKYFTPDFLEFFKELAANNHKEWFDENRKRYEKEVKDPFKRFVSDVIDEVKKYEPELLIAPKDAIFRINRDIRFAKDKTPYKTNVSALISPKGRKNHSYAAHYFELSPEHIGIYGGMYGGSTQEVSAMRTHLSNHMAEYEKLTKDKNFKKHFPEGVQGEAQKRVPKELKDQAEKYPVLLNKQFYYHASLEPELVYSDKLLPTMMEYYKASHDLKTFFRQPYD